MSYRRHSELLVGLLLLAAGCTDEFPEHPNSLVSNDGVYLVTLDLPADGLHAGEPAEMEFTVEHDGEAIEVEMPELHFEQHSGGSASGDIDLEAHAMHGHHAEHAFAAAGDYVLMFSFVADAHHEEEHDAEAPDEDGGTEAADAGTDADHALGERSEHEFEITVAEAEEHTHGEAAHADEHMH